ncbi:MAG TPA: branched-chain amino acid ABC transporter permease [Thermopetrobacter sp.]|nr:branched-chain amino acid ABC transporter permease [Thermopetrobacter sp.]
MNAARPSSFPRPSATDRTGADAPPVPSPAARLRRWLTAAELILLLLLVLAPWLTTLLDRPFLLDLATRLTILAMAAVSLNLILGIGGLVSFGHAAYLGIGAYAVAIPAWHAVYGGADWLAGESGFYHFALAAALGALFALLTGLVALRTRGVHFLMITMAFGQMVYWLLASLETYGGDDGLTIDVRSVLPGIPLDDPATMHMLAVAGLLLALAVFLIIARSPFGLVLAGARSNAGRMRALGHPVFAVRLLACVIAGLLASLAGALMADFTAYVSPAMTDWTRSGELMFMVILGGAGRPLGPLTGAAVFVLLEELLSQLTTYWHLPFGLLLIGVALVQARALARASGAVGRAGDGGGGGEAPSAAGEESS